MLSAIISDTLLLKSPTCTKKDVEVLGELEKITGLDINKYGLEMLKAGTDISTFSSEEVINLDAKESNSGCKKVIISQVNTADIDDVFSRREELEFAIEKEIADKKLDLYIIRKFLGTFFFSMVLILSIVVVFDLSERLEKFIENEAPVKNHCIRK